MMTDLRNYQFSKKENALFYFGIVIFAVSLSLLFYKNMLFAIVVIPFVSKIKMYITNIIINKRRNDYLMQFKDSLFVISTAIGAGRSMKEAIAEARDSLAEIYGENGVLTKDLNTAYQRMEIGGEADLDVLSDLAMSSNIEDVIDFVTIYSICKTTGASLIIALNKAANVIIEKMTIDKEVREIVKRKESEGLVIFVMPVLVLMFLNLSSPDYIAPMYNTFAGRLIMTGVIAANIGIYGIIQKVTKVEV